MQQCHRRAVPMSPSSVEVSKREGDFVVPLDKPPQATSSFGLSGARVEGEQTGRCHSGVSLGRRRW